MPSPRPRRSSTGLGRDRSEALEGLEAALRPRPHPCKLGSDSNLNEYLRLKIIASSDHNFLADLRSSGR